MDSVDLVFYEWIDLRKHFHRLTRVPTPTLGNLGSTEREKINGEMLVINQVAD